MAVVFVVVPPRRLRGPGQHSRALFNLASVPRPVLVAGTVALDLIAQVPQLPGPDEAVLADTLTERPGGCGGNTARALARLGHHPTLLSAVGEGFEASPYEAALLEDGVALDHLVRVQDASTARAVMIGDPTGSQLIVYHEGAMPQAATIEPLPSDLGVFAAGELSTYPELMAACSTSLLAPGQETFHDDPEVVLACIQAADVLVVNHHEAEVIAEHTGGIEALAQRVDTLIITDPGGQDIHQGDKIQRTPAVAAEPVGATGAGDGFTAGLVHCIAHGWSLPAACRMGSVVAACAIQAPGAQDGLPRLQAALARYRDAYGEPPDP